MTEQDSLTLLNVASLLHYPDKDMEALFATIELELRFLSDENALALAGFIDHARSIELTDLQAEYVRVFDMNSPCSLHLAWHKYGDDPRLGRALAGINELYRDAGFEPIRGAMPDYLPRILEFVAHAPDWAVKVLVDGFGKEIAALDMSIRESGGIYYPVLHIALHTLLGAERGC